MGAFPLNTTEDVAVRLQSAMAAYPAATIAVRCEGGFDGLPALVACAENWAKGGGTALLICADDIAARRARALAANSGATATTIAIVEATPLAASLVSTWGPASGCPRDGRLLDANEMDVLIEDVKVSGLKTGRLKEMLKFFRKTISDGESRKPFWLVTPEEQKVFAVLEENLEARRAMMPCEAAGMAQACIEGPLTEGGPAAVLAPLMPAFEGRPLRLFVHDFGALSHCAQELCRSLGAEGLAATVLAGEGSCASEPYPWAEGAAELQNEAAEVLVAAQEPASLLPPRVAAAPAQEFREAAEAVAQLITEGTAPSQILVAVPNGIWGSHIAKALEKRGIPCVRDSGEGKAKGDPRLLGQYEQLEQATLAKLLRSPNDLAALRTWLGLGDWLLASDAFLELLAWARDHDRTPFDALEHLLAHPEEASDMRLFHKLQRSMEALPAQLEQLRQSRAEGGLTDSRRPAPQDAVTIAPYTRCRSQSAEAVVLTGMVDGFLPRPDAFSDRFTIDHQRKALQREAALLADIQAAARRVVIPTLFQQDLVENADALGASISRIAMDGDTRIARIAPSRLLQTA